MISIVFADMDGTFLADDKSIPHGNMCALDLLAECGIPFVPCTGRPVSAVPDELMRHGATRFAVGSNGAVVYDVADQRALHIAPMDKRRILQLYEQVKDLHATFDIFADGEVFSERARYDSMGSLGIDEPSLAVLRRVRKPMDMLVPELLDTVKSVEKVTCFWKDGTDRDALARCIEDVGGFSSAHGHPKNFELQASGVSKGSALRWLCAHLGMSTNEAVAFGDEANDLPMMKTAGIGVAMANATPDVLQAADCVTMTNNEAGCASYLTQALHARLER